MSTFFDSLPGQWQDKVIFAIGALVFVSPWLLFYTDTPTAAWNAWTLGVVFSGGALIAIVYKPYWPEFVVAFMAFWHVLAPRILGYSGEVLPTWTAVGAGAVVVYLSLWSAIVRARLEQEAQAAPAGRATLPEQRAHGGARPKTAS